jgi:hypothetical protein
VHYPKKILYFTHYLNLFEFNAIAHETNSVGRKTTASIPHTCEHYEKQYKVLFKRKTNYDIHKQAYIIAILSPKYLLAMSGDIIYVRFSIYFHDRSSFMCTSRELINMKLCYELNKHNNQQVKR